MSISDQFASERILAKMNDILPKPRLGLERLDRDLRKAGVGPAARLHLVSAVIDLGRVADASRPARVARVADRFSTIR